MTNKTKHTTKRVATGAKPKSKSPVTKVKTSGTKVKSATAKLTTYSIALKKLHTYARARGDLALGDTFAIGCEEQQWVRCLYTKQPIQIGKKFNIILKPCRNVNSIHSEQELVGAMRRFGIFSSPQAAIMYARAAGAHELEPYIADFYRCDTTYELPRILAELEALVRLSGFETIENMARLVALCNPSDRDLAFINGHVTKHVPNPRKSSSDRPKKSSKSEEDAIASTLEEEVLEFTLDPEALQELIESQA